VEKTPGITKTEAKAEKNGALWPITRNEMSWQEHNMLRDSFFRIKVYNRAVQPPWAWNQSRVWISGGSAQIKQKGSWLVTMQFQRNSNIE
jgi:hypothetical protein